jgi:hypothetical protein
MLPFLSQVKLFFFFRFKYILILVGSLRVVSRLRSYLVDEKQVET